MPELESMIENKLIEQLFYGDSQWIYREDLKTENDLRANFKYILEQNNKDRLNGEHLSGGSSVYEDIDQYSALKTDENSKAPARDRFSYNMVCRGTLQRWCDPK